MQKDLPQLIVALDSTEESANYVHIADVKEGVNYYCPCCKGLVKPRAYKKEKDYLVQPHFYHEYGGCSEESFIHYICKMWLFEKGCKFKVEGIEYTVKEIETEKTLKTQFGDYRPDIIVHTECDKTFYFEIKYSNKKTEVYAPKWDDLGNDVVEVDARDFINNKHKAMIPEFKLIYSEGECFIKNYSRADYEDVIATRKLEWKRQDKLNYKIQWERLDWFWNYIGEYKAEKIAFTILMDSFKTLTMEDKEVCFDFIRRMSCIKPFIQKFRELIDNEIIAKIDDSYILNKLIDNENISSIKINFQRRSQICVSCRYFDNKVIQAIHSQEWFFRISNVKKLIEMINCELFKLKRRKDNQIFLNENIFEIYSEYKKKMKKSIWELTRKERRFNIGIRNGDSYWLHRNFEILSYDIYDLDVLDYNFLSSIFKKKLEYNMREIREYVLKNDGRGRNCTFRHMLVSNKEVEND